MKNFGGWVNMTMKANDVAAHVGQLFSSMRLSHAEDLKIIIAVRWFLTLVSCLPSPSTMIPRANPSAWIINTGPYTGPFVKKKPCIFWGLLFLPRGYLVKSSLPCSLLQFQDGPYGADINIRFEVFSYVRSLGVGLDDHVEARRPSSQDRVVTQVVTQGNFLSRIRPASKAVMESGQPPSKSERNNDPPKVTSLGALSFQPDK